MVETIREKIAEGYGRKEIAEMCDSTVWKIDYAIKKAGYLSFRELQNKTRYGEEAVVKILDLIEEGNSLTYVLKKTGMSEINLTNALNSEGYKNYQEAREDLYLWREDTKILEELQEYVTDELSIRKATKLLDLPNGRIKSLIDRNRKKWPEIKQELMQKK